MRDFHRDNNSGGRREFGRRDFGKRAQMHQATCSKCGKACEVPFNPTGNRPVFCSNCFRENGGNETRRFGGENSGRSNFEDRQMYEAVCDTCGNTCKIPFQPRNGKPVYCSNCFEGRTDRNEHRPANREQAPSQDQFAALNTKLDKILSLLQPTAMKVTKAPREEKAASPVEKDTSIEAKPKIGKKMSSSPKPTI